jgi:hypothetical protein
VIKRDEIEDQSSCFNKARDSERLFVMLARDPAAPVAILAWVAERIRLGKNVREDAQIVEALDCAQRMVNERSEIEAARSQEKLWAEDAPIECSRLQSTRDMTPRQALFPRWDDFVSWFSPVRVAPCTREDCVGSTCPHKPGVCWSPAVFSHKGTRSHRDVTSLSLLVFDIEDLTEDQLDALSERLRGYRYLMHATHSDRPDHRAVHVIVALSRAVPRDEWSRFWRAAADRLAPSADPACGDPSRIYFMPSRPTGAGYFITTFVNGQPLNVDSILLHAPASRASRGLEGTVSL